VLEDGADRMVIGKLFQMRGAVELKARLANTVWSASWYYKLWTSVIEPIHCIEKITFKHLSYQK